MKLFYKNRKLGKSVNSLTDIAKNYGTHAKKVNQRIKALNAAPTLDTMRKIPAANCHELVGELKGKLAVDISGNHRIIFEPNYNPLPERNDGGLDWTRVLEIIIIDIGEDYH